MFLYRYIYIIFFLRYTPQSFFATKSKNVFIYLFHYYHLFFFSFCSVFSCIEYKGVVEKIRWGIFFFIKKIDCFVFANGFKNIYVPPISFNKYVFINLNSSKYFITITLHTRLDDATPTVTLFVRVCGYTTRFFSSQSLCDNIKKYVIVAVLLLNFV